MNILAVAIGGFLGAVARFLVSSRFPGLTGILLANTLGSFLFGLTLRTVNETGTFASFWFVGFLGAFTTFSTFALKLVETWKDGKPVKAAVYAAATLAAGFSAVLLGWWLSGR